MKKLSVDGIGLVFALQLLFVIIVLTRGKSLLIVNLAETFTHVVHYGNFRRDLAFRGPPLGEKGLYHRAVLLDVPVIDVTKAIYVEDSGVVEVVVEREEKSRLMDN